MEQEKSGKKFLKIALAAAGVILTLVIIKEYENIDALIRFYILKEPVVVFEDGSAKKREPNKKDLEKEKEFWVSGEKAGFITPEMAKAYKGVGESVIVQGNSPWFGDVKMQYTLNGTKVYKDIHEAGIAITECSGLTTADPEFVQTLLSYQFMLVDMTVSFLEITRSREKPDDEYPLPLSINSLLRGEDYRGIDEDSQLFKTGSYIWYFDKHPKLDSAITDDRFYEYYDLSKGESMTFKIGIAIPQEGVEKKTTYLQIYDSSDEVLPFINGFKLFD